MKRRPTPGSQLILGGTMCLSCFTSCAVSVCSTICCNACCKVQKLQSVGTRLSYAIMLLFSFTFALIARTWPLPRPIQPYWKARLAGLNTAWSR